MPKPAQHPSHPVEHPGEGAQALERWAALEDDAPGFATQPAPDATPAANGARTEKLSRVQAPTERVPTVEPVQPDEGDGTGEGGHGRRVFAIEVECSPDGLRALANLLDGPHARVTGNL